MSRCAKPYRAFLELVLGARYTVPLFCFSSATELDLHCDSIRSSSSLKLNKTQTLIRPSFVPTAPTNVQTSRRTEPLQLSLVLFSQRVNHD